MIRMSIVLALCSCIALVGCGWFGGDDPPPQTVVAAQLPQEPQPTIISLTFDAGPDLNLDHQGQAKPVAVTIYQLTDKEAFSTADFFDLAQALGGDAVEIDKMTLGPGRVDVYQRTINDRARFIAITAAYSRLDSVNWRAWHEIDRGKTTFLTAKLTAEGVKLKLTSL